MSLSVVNKCCVLRQDTLSALSHSIQRKHSSTCLHWWLPCNNPLSNPYKVNNSHPLKKVIDTRNRSQAKRWSWIKMHTYAYKSNYTDWVAKTVIRIRILNSPDMGVFPVVIVTRSSQRRVIAGHTLGVGFLSFYLSW